MGTVDDFVAHTIARGLQPGEAVIGAGHVRRETGMQSSPYDDWIGVATDRRLLLFRTTVTGIGTFTVQPQNLEFVEWCFQDLYEVWAVDESGLIVSITGPMRRFGFTPYEGLGPPDGARQRYTIPRNSLGLAGQVQFYEQFLGWLKPRVESRAFPMTDDRRQIVMQLQARREATEAARRAAGAQAAKNAKAMAPYALAAIPLISALVGVVALSNAVSGVSSAESGRALVARNVSAAQDDLTAWREGRVPPSNAGCQPGYPDPYMTGRGYRYFTTPAGASVQCEPLAQYESRLEVARGPEATYAANRALQEGRILPSIAWMILSLLATAGAILWAKKRSKS